MNNSLEKIIFLGTGSAFNTKDYQSNALVQIGDKRLLIDCGSLMPIMLEKSKYSLSDIDSYYISHLHADHTGGLEFVAFNTYFNPALDKPNLIANHIVIKNLWDHCLSGGMDSVQGLIAKMPDFFKIRRVKDNGSFVFEGTKFQTVQVAHVSGGFAYMPSYGLIFKLNGRKVFFTTDTQFSPNQMRDYYEMVDIIFQDCETTPWEYKSQVHAHYEELKTLPDHIRKKMYLYHYSPGNKPNCRNDGFRGWVKRGKEYVK